MNLQTASQHQFDYKIATFADDPLCLVLHCFEVLDVGVML
jgi:hypothetical protein